MKRIQEKIKDLVEVRSYRSIKDFISNPEQTLSAYHFTDVTAEMMSKWLDKVCEVQPQNGQAKALAGYRGVGKSHFLATLGAIISHPELRSRISEGYVSASAQRLKRRRYPVGYVRRGTHETLIEEIKDAIAKALEINVAELPDTLEELMVRAAELAGDVPFILFVDTAYDRAKRVARDDGEPLGRLAELTKSLNIFVGIALDDDIAGADGLNAAIARSYAIDYLDQEHLYRIIETNLFPKQRQTQHLMHEIYTEFREALPSFRWSEQRFTALYPLHPVILEVAPFVRLYDTNFVILEFAAEAAAKSIGRPANSLVALDEVFDGVENSLRKSDDLKEVFETFDKINSEIISSIPIMQRLHAKLILKALLILSLDGEGTTAPEISSAMLISSENDPQSSIKLVEDTLESFYAANPEKVNRLAEIGRETRYGFRISGKDGINTALTEKAAGVGQEVVEKILRKFAKDRFADWQLNIEVEMPLVDTSECNLIWRGGIRRGKLVWNWDRRGGLDKIVSLDRSSEFLDWEVYLLHPGQFDSSAIPQTDLPAVFWQPAELKTEEIDTMRRYHVLLNDLSLRDKFGDQVRAAGHTHHTQIEKIWKRIFIEDGKLIFDGQENSFLEETRDSQTISELFGRMLMPLFEVRYQHHPYFTRNLGMVEVSQIVNEHFSGAKQTLPEVQELARDIALPLGLVVEQGSNFILESDEKLVNIVFSREVMDLVEAADGQSVTLKTIYQKLKGEPFGLPREAQHLVLAALVAQRRLEFITSKGDRINRRSLDLKIIWDDIVGVAKPKTPLYGSLELTKWARILTGVDTFQTIDNPSDCELMYLAMRVWFEDWNRANVLERFESLSDEILNTKIWKLARHAQMTFGSVATTVEQILEKTISLEEGLQRVADAFSDSEDEFYLCAKNLVILEDFISGLALRETVWEYIAVCEATDDDEIEILRDRLLNIIEEVRSEPNESLNKDLEIVWNSYHSKFSNHFAIKHDSIMKSHLLQEKFDQMMKSDEWWEFENLSRIPIFHRHYGNEAEKLRRQFKELDCSFDVKEMLKVHPFCACSFSLSQMPDWEKLPEKLETIVRNGRDSYRKTLLDLKSTLIPLLKEFVVSGTEPEFAKASEYLIELLEAGDTNVLMNNQQLIILNKVIHGLTASPQLAVKFPENLGYLSSSELQEFMNQWIIQLPNEPCILEI